MQGQSTPIDVIIADDHEIFRDGFRVMLNKIPEINLIGEASNGNELIEMARKLKPDVVITDIMMPVMDGIEATRILVKESPGIGIIALTMFEEDNLIIEILEAGAKGYLIKNAHKQEFITALHSVYKKERYYCRSTTDKIVRMIENKRYNPYKKKYKPQFSENEITVMRLLCEQYSNKEMAMQMHLSIRTIESYRLRILAKIKARNTAGIIVYALRNNIFR